MIPGSGATTSAAMSTGNFVVNAASNLFFGSFNPNYKKKDQKRMRYIQFKYAQAYGGEELEDPLKIINNIDPNSKLKMDPNGIKPANPFPDERGFEESLLLNVYPVSGHQGRFAASHAVHCLGKIIEYQIQRRSRPWVPGISNPGRPNDYINLFLEEIKTWLRNQLTLDIVHSEELQRRDDYFSKLKHDNYYWCFPPESGEYRLHAVIDFVHDTVLEALEIVSTEEKNKSLQTLFKELNDQTTNSFEFGKLFLGYLTATGTKRVGVDLLHSTQFDGRRYDSGKLHKQLLRVTDCVIRSYVSDMKASDLRVKATVAARKGIDMGDIGAGRQSSLPPPPYMRLDDLQETMTYAGRTGMTTAGAGGVEGVVIQGDYEVGVDYDNSSNIGSVVYLIEVKDPNGYNWVVRRTYAELQRLHQNIGGYYEGQDVILELPQKIQKVLPSGEDYEDRAEQIAVYLFTALNPNFKLSKAITRLLCEFLECRNLIEKQILKTAQAETIPNVFTELKETFRSQLLYTGKLVTNGSNGNGNSTNAEQKSEDTSVSASTSPMAKDLIKFRLTWGIELVFKIIDAYALLQRLAAILGWTLEINHFFVSMFGNTLAFSKLPLRQILLTLKDILSKFLSLANDLFKNACQINADRQYKWHKNLQMTENQLKLVKHHGDKAINLINQIDSEHLDYDYQIARLQEVNSRFYPLMNRIGNNLLRIQEELKLPSRMILPDNDAEEGDGGGHPGVTRARDQKLLMGDEGLNGYERKKSKEDLNGNVGANNNGTAEEKGGLRRNNKPYSSSKPTLKMSEKRDAELDADPRIEELPDEVNSREVSEQANEEKSVDASATLRHLPKEYIFDDDFFDDDSDEDEDVRAVVNNKAEPKTPSVVNKDDKVAMSPDRSKNEADPPSSTTCAIS